MKVLIACEFSGIVRQAFKEKGHDAWSCDLLPTEIPGQHIQGDVLEILNDEWDLLIAFPPCTYLSVISGKSFSIKKYGNDAIDRWEKRIDALRFFMKFANADIPKVCIENPMGFINTAYRKPDQIIHPYYFGKQELKRTCLWLKNLPKLHYRLQDDLFGKRTSIDYPEPIGQVKSGRNKGKNLYWFDSFLTEKLETRSHSRSRIFQVFANAMANQWG